MAPQLIQLHSGNIVDAQEKFGGHRSISRIIASFHKYLIIRAVVRDYIGIADLLPAIWGPSGKASFQKKKLP
jgi:hypothetical protein